MKLEDQVCSLELAQRLKGLGVKQDSWFWWLHDKDTNWELTYHGKDDDWLGMVYHHDTFECVSAFTVAELGEMLIIPNTQTHLMTYRSELKYFGGEIKDIVRKMAWYGGTADTEADLRAQTLLHLIKIKVITPQ